ncbi:hypothetical protein, partial [Streptococcus pseudopneumoniae]|uniref:hypothetical protein n=1 Tax=Streptococcus pseudopneumoniae TaxID=257758 RepID=UPI001BB18BA4
TAWNGEGIRIRNSNVANIANAPITFAFGTNSAGAEIVGVNRPGGGADDGDADLSFRTLGGGSWNDAVFTTDGDFGIGTTAPGTNTKLGIVGGAVDINSSSTTSDASLHIKTSYGGFDRLTQISPTGVSKPGLNLLASTNAGSALQFWVWGPTSDNVWRIQDGTGFS